MAKSPFSFALGEGWIWRSSLSTIAGFRSKGIAKSPLPLFLLEGDGQIPVLLRAGRRLDLAIQPERLAKPYSHSKGIVKSPFPLRREKVGSGDPS
jgi:hypothetical protein